MKSGILNSKMFELGSERLKLLGNYAEPLMQAYLTGEFDEAAVGERVLQRLIQARVLWRPEVNQGLKLRPQVGRMLAGMISDESRRQAHAEVSDELDRIETTVLSYQAALEKGNHHYAEQQLQAVMEYVYDLTGQFDEAIDSLWHRLNSHFGFVSSIGDKIRENERAQKQVQRLLTSLEQIKLDDMIALAGHSVPLRRLLVVFLNERLTVLHSSLLAVQERMIELLARFREQQSRSLLVSNMAAYLRQNPQFVPGDYAWRKQVPDLINQASIIQSHAYAALDREQDQDRLAEVIASLPRINRPSSEPMEMATAGKAAQHQEVAAREQALRNDVEQYFLTVLTMANKAQQLSAHQYLIEQKLSWPAEIWLFQVLAEFQTLNAAERALFKLTYDEAPTSVFNQVQLVRDLSLGLSH